MRAITTRRELIALWLRMRRSLAQFSGSDELCRMPWSEGCIINTSESKFSVHARDVALCETVVICCTIATPSTPSRSDRSLRQVGSNRSWSKVVLFGERSLRRALGDYV